MSSDDSDNNFNRHREKFKRERSGECKGQEQVGTDVEADMFGPALPPHLLNKKTDVYGPVLPSHLQKSEDAFGPMLPPTYPNKVYGPRVPDNILKSDDNVNVPKVIGPEIPDCLKTACASVSSDEESDADVGPDPRLMCEEGTSYGAEELERRAFKMKRKLAGQEEEEKEMRREEWMLELPSDKAANLGLGPRQFKRKLGPDKNEDRSVWTDTPSEKARKEVQTPKMDDKEIMKRVEMRERDKEMEKLMKKAKKKLKKEKTLLEIHQKKLQKKAKKDAKKREKEGKPVERRPFDRNIDLQANRFDEAQKRSIIKKAQLLDDRFSSGQSKFL